MGLTIFSPEAKRMQDQFEKAIDSIANKVDELDESVKEFAENNLKEIPDAFEEVKDDFLDRLNIVENPNNYQYLGEAFNELADIFEVVVDILNLKEGLNSFLVSNDVKGGEVVTSNLTKENKNGETIKITFNFEPIERAEQRVSFMKGNLSVRIDHVVPKNKEGEPTGELGEVYIDLDTPSLNKVLNGVEDENGNWHHFKSESLSGFATEERFKKLVEVFKELLSQQHFTLEELMQKFNKK
ncbi:MAG: hypothetical protein ABIA91_02415 [Patescibacteria group bacterium]